MRKRSLALASFALAPLLGLALVRLAAADEAGKLPDPCSGFLSTKRTKLSRVYGDHAWKHGASVNAVAVSPNGQLALSGSDDQTTKVWDLATGRERRTFETADGSYPSKVQCVAISRDGKRALTGGGGQVVLWDVETGNKARILDTDAEGVTSLAFTYSGRRAAAASGNSIAIWDLAESLDGSNPRRIEGKAASVLAFIPDGTRLVSASDSDDGQLIVWSAINGGIVRILADKVRITALAISPTEHRLVAAVSKGPLTLWDLKTGGARALGPKDSSASVRSVAFSPDGKRVLTAGAAIDLWNVADGALLRHIDPGSTQNAIAFVPDGKDAARALSGGADGMLRLWDLEKGQPASALSGHEGRVSSIAVIRSGLAIATGGADGKVRLWERASGKELACLGGSITQDVSSIAVSADGARLFAGEAQTLRVWDLEKRTSIAGISRAHTLLAASRDGRRLVATRPEGTLELRDGATGVVQATIELRMKTDRPHKAECLDLSPDGRFVLYGTDESMAAIQKIGANIEMISVDPETPTLHVRDLEGGNIRSFAHGDVVGCAAFALDGKQAISGTASDSGPDEAAVKLWDLASGAALASFGWKKPEGSRGTISIDALAAQPGGRIGLAAVSLRGAEKLWRWIKVLDLESHEELDTIDLGTSGSFATSLAFLPDGRSFVAGTTRGVVLEFSLDSSR